jgi:hypothetical protein
LYHFAIVAEEQAVVNEGTSIASTVVIPAVIVVAVLHGLGTIAVSIN